MADTITFDGLGGANADPIATYSEDGYTLSVTSGDVFQGQVFGNPTPSLVIGSVFDGSQSATLDLTFAGGLFDLTSFDFAVGASDDELGSYMITGFLGGSSVYSVSGSSGPTQPNFVTIAGDPAFVDRISLMFTSGGSSINLDNLVVNAGGAVPEPATWAMLLAGFGLVGVGMRRSTRRLTQAI